MKDVSGDDGADDPATGAAEEGPRSSGPRPEDACQLDPEEACQPGPQDVDLLDPEDAALLDLEDGWQHGRLKGDKETLIHDRLAISSPRYHQRLNALLDDPRAARYAPALVNRLRRVRDGRREARSADRLR